MPLLDRQTAILTAWAFVGRVTMAFLEKIGHGGFIVNKEGF